MEEKMKDKTIRFNDLSFWLQAGIVGGFMYLIFFVGAFLLGFLSGLGL